MTKETASWDQIVAAETAALRDAFGPQDPSVPADGTSQLPRASSEAKAEREDGLAEPLGIALSGGGVRSASFTTGVLQFLARQPALVQKLRWVSMVSGGGFAGSSLAAIMLSAAKREHSPLEEIDLESDRIETARIQEAGENRIINAIRENSSYLTPGRTLGRRGRASLVAHYLFGLAFNLSEVAAVVVAALGLVGVSIQLLLAPWDRNVARFGFTALALVSAALWECWHSWPYWRNLRALGGPIQAIKRKEYGFLVAAAAAAVAVAWWPDRVSQSHGLAITLGLTVVVIAALVRWKLKGKPTDKLVRTPGFSRRLGTWSLVLGALALAIDDMPGPDPSTLSCPENPLLGLLTPLQLGYACHEGAAVATELTGAALAARWMRVAACVALLGALRPVKFGRFALGIGAVVVLALSVAWMRWFGDSGPRFGIGFVATFLLGLALTLGDFKAPFDASKVLEGASTRIVLGSYVVGAGTGLQLMHEGRSHVLEWFATLASAVGVESLGTLEASLAALVTGVLSYALAFITRTVWARGLSSPHHQYRQALKEAFLDGPRSELWKQTSQPSPSTISESPDAMQSVAIKELKPTKDLKVPLFIWNMAANLRQSTATGAADRRKVARFEITPVAAGYAGRACLLSDEANPAARWFSEMNVEKAMATSGAAVSPRMGFYSQGWVWTLTTILNLRLGARAPDPVDGTGGDPTFIPTPVGFLSKWLRTHRQVYLTDGGHYDNSGILALIARRVPFIIAIDAEQDAASGFKAMADAIRLARTDYGAHIRIDVSGLAPDERGFARAACALGTIEYSGDDPRQTPPGRLLYIKASLRGDEPVDVRHYRASHRSFPHEPTGNQFFTEEQFDAYRELGFHLARRTFKPLTWDWRASPGAKSKTLGATESLGDIFATLSFAWSESRSCTPDQFVTLTKKWSDLLREDDLRPAPRTQPGSAPPPAAAEPEVSTMYSVAPTAEPTPIGPPSSTANAPLDDHQASAAIAHVAGTNTSGRGAALQWIQFCEQVFVVTRLWQNIDAPDNAGWLHTIARVFERGDVKRAWSHPEIKELYGADFQHFVAMEIQVRSNAVDDEGRSVADDSNDATSRAVSGSRS